MKVLYITDQMYLHGGAERVLTNKVNFFVSENLAEICIITSEQKGNNPCYPIDNRVIFKDLGVNYNRSVSYFYPSNFIKIPKHFFRLVKMIGNIKPDIIITLSSQFDYYFLPFIYKKIPKIKEFHSSRHYAVVNRKKNKSKWRKLLYNFNDYIESNYNKLAILNEDEKQYFKSSNTVVIPNSYTNYPIKKSDLKNKIVISAGRIAPVKQFDKLILAWSYVAKVYPDWNLKIYGKGEKKELFFLQKLINKLALTDKIEFCGTTNNLEYEMQNSSIFVMSSKTECFPMVLLEAMTCGLPIVSFDCPHGPSNIITDNEDGILVDPENEKKLAESIISIIGDNHGRSEKGKKSRENVKRFSSEKIGNQWALLFTNLINN